MKLIKILIILFLINLQSNLFSQETQSVSFKSPQQAITQQIQSLEISLINKNTARLEEILHSDLRFGHSNGWIETKKSLLENLPTSKVFYREFIKHKEAEIKIIWEANPLAIVNREIIAVGEYEKEAFQVDLKVLEIWIKQNKNWLLLARQSVEVDFDK